MSDTIFNTLGVHLVIHEPPTDEEIMQSYGPELWKTKKVGRKEVDILNESAYGRAFRDIYQLRYNNGLFYTRDGKQTEDMLAKEIWQDLDGFGIYQDVERTTKKLLGAVKLASTVPALKTDEDIIPFANGDFIISRWEFNYDLFSPTAYRLPAVLVPDILPTPYFHKWLHDLFCEDDITVLQEYLGYCLVCNTKAQKALFLVGEGGAGKSGLGVILQAILGDAELNIANTQEFLQDKFKLPELEHKLVLYDDDLDSSALTETGLYKKLITNTLDITADRKYGHPFKLHPQIKLVACCNKMLSSMYDNTSGFYRRLLPIMVKPIAKDFVPDLNFYDKLKAERDGIVQWALAGLKRLYANNWVLSESSRTKEYLATKQGIENPLPDFMDTVFVFDENLPGITVTEITRAYETWCRKNGLTPVKPRVLQLWMSDNAEKYGIKPSTHIKRGEQRVRGYQGLTITQAWDDTGKISLV